MLCGSVNQLRFSIFVTTNMVTKLLKFATKAPSTYSGKSLMSNVCKLARLLTVRIISLQSLHLVTLVPITTLAPILVPLFACSPEEGLEGGTSEAGTSL